MTMNHWTLVLKNTSTITTLFLILLLQPAYSQSPVEPSSVEFQVNWMEMAKIDKGAIKNFNGRFALAVSVSIFSNHSDSTISFDLDNTKIVFTDGSESNIWLAWFPELKGYDFNIRGKGGSMTNPQIVFADDGHNSKYGRPYGGESYLEIGGEAGISGVYHPEKNGQLIVHFIKPKISRNPIFLFPLQSKQPQEIAMIKLGGLMDVTIPNKTVIKSFNAQQTETTTIPISVSPTESDSLDKLVKVIISGDWESAVPYLKQAIEKDPDNEILHYLLSNAYYFQNDFKLQSIEKKVCFSKNGAMNSILTWVKNLESLHPNNAIVHLLLADAYGGNLQLEKAIKENNNALALNPDLIAAKINLGNIYLMQKDYQKADSILKKALETEPDNAVIHGNLGSIQDEKGNLDAAMKHYKKAIELNPYVPVYTRIGFIYCRKGDWEAGISNLNKAIELNPDDAEAHCVLGIAFLEGKNNKENARSFFNKALELDPNGDIGKKARYCLQNIN